ncbi:MAG: FAD-dependent oxidoreductase [Clostridia bacterium]|nr:FAD-dependent oxidoreductase [Clostridia bacterium]MBO5092005.1 FAD-dependent oxidoreductase [Clostridia bacterium]MBP3494679.1 FAD-dependent oxidoreductase [Clostridia bacterium]MBQ7788802.1 FAD-dependent oxidoreductase [Clostridia bacterium]
MTKYIEESNQIPVIADVDVLVCGGGPAGIGAAIRAAREGVSVMVVEAMDCLGGIATAGMMSHWGGRSSSKVMQEIFDLTYEKAQDAGWHHPNWCGKDAIYHDVQKIVLDEMFLKENIRVLYYTHVCKAVVENGSIIGVIVENKSGRGFIKAKRVVDSTGDGDVAASAGVPYFKGRESDGRMQPCTIMFKICGVDYKRAVFPPSFETTVDTPKGELQALAKELLPFPAGHVLLYTQPTPDTVCCNMTNAIEIDGTDAESLSKGVMICRSQILPIIKFLKEYVPGYENCWLMSTASLIGIRETRHFEGIESLSKDDILEAKFHDNWVVRRAWFNFDVHNLTGASLDKTGVQHGWKQNNDYTIPYGCLLPKTIEGLLLSGRNISGSHLAHSNFRIMSVCIALGEAAGVAAALSVKQGKALRDVDVKEIQEIVGE